MNDDTIEDSPPFIPKHDHDECHRILRATRHTEQERDRLRALLDRALDFLSRRRHHSAHCWAKKFMQCEGEPPAECTCGADAENAERAQLVREIKGVIK